MLDKIKAIINNLSQKNLLLPLIGIVALFLLVFVVIASILSSQVGKSKPSPTPSPVREIDRLPQEKRLSPLQRTVIDQTTQKEIGTSPGIENNTLLSDGSRLYTFTSPLTSRKNEVIVKDGKVIFERILTPERSTAQGYARLSEFTKRYGQAEEVIVGSSFYGRLMSTYIYASQGFSLIGNPRTNEVFEIQHFAPTTVDTYKKQFGGDIQQDPDSSI